MLRAQRTQAPAVRILTLQEVKAHCRVDQDNVSEDAMLSSMILAAEARLDGYSGLIGRCLISQKWTVGFRDWPSIRLDLPLHDVTAVTVSYFDDENETKLLPEGEYLLQQGLCGPFLEWMDSFSCPSTYDRSDAVKVEMTCGFGPGVEDIPEDLRMAAKLIVSNWYQNRESLIVGSSVADLPVPHDVLWLLFPYRRSFI
ncbi:hypothetical protein G6L14_02210 [Agrobacterium vitis]|uniref:head-tail connector protein n=1 Tax=Agrobacterium vitis TaxID=373 RepID=UPI001574CD19|nr:head-tail connector protein [Agrobacterium vitis]NSY10829.1 hypothetical protein [Agrobacterium vitis]